MLQSLMLDMINQSKIVRKMIQYYSTIYMRIQVTIFPLIQLMIIRRNTLLRLSLSLQIPFMETITQELQFINLTSSSYNKKCTYWIMIQLFHLHKNLLCQGRKVMELLNGKRKKMHWLVNFRKVRIQWIPNCSNLRICF